MKCYSKQLKIFYSVLVCVFAVGMIVTYFTMPIEIPKICALAFVWSLFGYLINSMEWQSG